MSKELVISANRHETRVAIARRRSGSRSLPPARERILAGGQHSQRQGDPRAAGHAVGVRRHRPGPRRVPVRLRFLRGQRGIRQDRNQRGGESPEAGPRAGQPASAAASDVEAAEPEAPAERIRSGRAGRARRRNRRRYRAAMPLPATQSRGSRPARAALARGGAGRVEGRGLPESKYYSAGGRRPAAAENRRPNQSERPPSADAPAPRRPAQISSCCPANRSQRHNRLA